MKNSRRVDTKLEDFTNHLVELFDFGVSQVKPQNILGNFLSCEDRKIVVTEKKREIIYPNVNQVFILCIGKASTNMAKTAKKILSSSKCKIKNGVVVVNKENFKNVNGFKCFSSGHPIPNSNGLKASKFIKKYLQNSTKKDLVLVFLSGGGSSLLPFPAPGITLKDKIKMNKILLESGANIKEINTVRKHLSLIKGGNLAKMCMPSNVHCFVLSDVVGDDLSSIASGLTTPDNSTFSDAEKIMKKYKIWKKSPKQIQNHILLGLKNKKLETPKENNSIFWKVKNTLIGSNNICLQNIQEHSNKNNIKSKIWKKNIDEDVIVLSKQFTEYLTKQKHEKPFLLISGGETTVKIRGKGKGGRNQEFALQFLKEIKKKKPSLKFILLSAGTDGRDGPTNAAGAMINHNSLKEIKMKKIDLTKELRNNNSYEVLKKIKSLVIIKGTDTNVADVQLLFLI